MKRIIPVLLVTAAVTGCNTFGGSSTFACKAPDGVTCTSVSGVYANKDQIVRSQRRGGNDRGEGDPVQRQSGSPINGFLPVTTGTPLMSETKIMRIWFAPWKDTENDMHDESMVYTVRAQGHWLVDEHNTRLQKSNAVFSIQNLKSADEPQRKVSLEQGQ